MVVPKVEVFANDSSSDLQDEINDFLSDKDVRQIVKMEYNSSYGSSSDLYSCIIMYIDLADVRDIKIDTILDK